MSREYGWCRWGRYSMWVLDNASMRVWKGYSDVDVEFSKKVGDFFRSVSVGLRYGRNYVRKSGKRYTHRDRNMVLVCCTKAKSLLTT